MTGQPARSPGALRSWECAICGEVKPCGLTVTERGNPMVCEDRAPGPAQPWGYCEPRLHEGRKVPAIWRVQGLVPAGARPGLPDTWAWVTEAGPGGMWAACNRHLQYACLDLLNRYDRVTVTEVH